MAGHDLSDRFSGRRITARAMRRAWARKPARLALSPSPLPPSLRCVRGARCDAEMPWGRPADCSVRAPVPSPECYRYCWYRAVLLLLLLLLLLLWRVLWRVLWDPALHPMTYAKIGELQKSRGAPCAAGTGLGPVVLEKSLMV